MEVREQSGFPGCAPEDGALDPRRCPDRKSRRTRPRSIRAFSVAVARSPRHLGSTSGSLFFQSCQRSILRPAVASIRLLQIPTAEVRRRRKSLAVRRRIPATGSRRRVSPASRSSRTLVRIHEHETLENSLGKHLARCPPTRQRPDDLEPLERRIEPWCNRGFLSLYGRRTDNRYTEQVAPGSRESYLPNRGAYAVSM